MILFFLVFLNFTKMNFLLLLMFSTMISVSSNNWLGCWIGLEINLLSFIPLISNNKNMSSSEASLKYFLIQAIASMNFLFIIIIMMLNMKNINNILGMILNSTLLMKMGAAPFHFWFPNIIEGLSWFNCFLLMTWQKITPMILLSYFFNYKYLIIISMLSLAIGSLGGLNQISIRKLLSFSSISHISWMILAMLININLWNLYFSFYLFMMMLMCMLFYFFNVFYLNQLFYMKINSMSKIILMLNLLTLGGLPPFLGFLPKWMIINMFMYQNLNFLIFLLVIFTLITLFYYIQICYSFFFLSNLKLKWNLFIIKNKIFNMLFLMSFISMSCLTLMTMNYLLL